MISKKKLDEQLERINFHSKGWGRTEVDELCNILMPDEEIEECVNGYYEAGFALLTATKNRLLLVDKKPLGYLTVEDMRFDMINEFDLHKRLFGAQVRVSAGNKTLFFTSMNQVRLRRLLNYVQTRMTQIKKDQEEHLTTQKQHLEEMNEQLRMYLMAAHKQQYVSQANAISANHTYGQPIDQRQPYQYPDQHLEQPPAAPAIQEESSPATPFEEAALAAFDKQTAPTADVIVPPQEAPPFMPSYSEQSSQAEESQSPRSTAHIMRAVPKYSQQALKQAEQIVMTPQQVGLAAARRVIPIISAYSRLPLMSQRRRYGYGPPERVRQ